MKKKLLIVLVCLTGLSVQSQVGLEGVIVEKFYISDEADSINADENFAVYPLHVGSVTYRVYADLRPGYKVIQMFGSQAHPLNIQTTTAFYNDPNYGFSTYQGTSVVNTKKHTTLIDSYLTIGGVATGLMGVLKTEDTDGNIGNLQGVLANDDPAAGLPITGASGVDGLMPGSPILPNILGLTSELDVFDQTVGNSFSTSGGTVAALGGVAGVTESNRVLLGQFTTDGVFSFDLNIQIATPIEGQSQIFVSSDAANDEIVDTTLTYSSDSEIINSVKTPGITAGQDFVIYPNPCQDILTINKRGSMVGQYEINVYDPAGRIVLQKSTSSFPCRLHVDALSEGIYHVEMRNEGLLQSTKFIKN